MDTKATATLIDGSKVKGRLTTEHAASSYNQPVFVDKDNQAIDWASITDISTAGTIGATKTDKKAASSRENGKKGGRVTQAVVDRWLETNRPNLATYEYQVTKGFYKRNIGPVHSFQGIGATWKQVLDHLKTYNE